MTNANRCLLLGAALLLLGCGRSADDSDGGHAHEEAHSWSVTAWGAQYEIFAECDPLIAGDTALAHTHVTRLSDFSPVTAARVSAVLAADGRETVFEQGTPVRAGIFSIRIAPEKSGMYMLSFRIDTDLGSETVPGFLVRVGTGDAPGGPVDASAHRGDHVHGPETIPFLKEQQWKTPFQTARADSGALRDAVNGPARIRAAAGAEAVVTAPLDGIVSAQSRLHVGMAVTRDADLLRLGPRAPADLNLAELEADLSVARSRLERLESLFEIGAVSQSDVEAARARVAALEPRLAAARGSDAGGLMIRSPLSGRIAELNAIPGQAVSAGDALVRIVRVPPVWVEVSLSARDAARVERTPAGLVLLPPGREPIELLEDLSLVSLAPEVDRGTGAVGVIFEVQSELSLPIGSAVDAQVLLPDAVRGIVIPASAVVDDGGVTVVYEQTEGETFARREVAVARRQGAHVLVTGLTTGVRVVSVGGAAIRRAELMSTGEVEGHVH